MCGGNRGVQSKQGGHGSRAKTHEVHIVTYDFFESQAFVFKPWSLLWRVGAFMMSFLDGFIGNPYVISCLCTSL